MGSSRAIFTSDHLVFRKAKKLLACAGRIVKVIRERWADDGNCELFFICIKAVCPLGFYSEIFQQEFQDQFFIRGGLDKESCQTGCKTKLLF